MKLCFTLLLILNSYCVFAQSSNNKKAQLSFERANALIEKSDYSAAEQILKSAVEADPLFQSAYILLGNVQKLQKKYTEAKAAYQKSVLINTNVSPTVIYNLAETEFATQDYDKAKIHFASFLISDSSSDQGKKARKYLLDCDFASISINKPVVFKPTNLGKGINTTDAEYFPALTADGETLIFTRQVSGNEDFWTSQFKNNAWTEATPLSPKINTLKYNEGAQTISPDGKYLFFTGCNRPDGSGRCDIYVSHREGKDWGEPYNLGKPVNSEYWESQPAISPDGRTLYFISNRPGGSGGYDIWKSTITDDAKWGPAINLGSDINTAYDENTPFLHADGRTLYFSSDGWPGFGHKDIFYSRMDENGKFNKPLNMGYPINSYEDENGLIVNANGNFGMFSSNLTNGFGVQDIYSFGIPESAKPLKISYVKGIVRDKDTKKTIESNVQVIDLKTSRAVFDDYTDAETGQFLAVMPVGSNYLFNVNADGYLFYSENFELKQGNINQPYQIEVFMEKIKPGANVTLKNIFFDTNKYNLLSASIRELDLLIDFLQQNESVSIEIQGHTDNIGDDQLNKKLSFDRANAVHDYLTKNKVDAKRLTFKGFGAEKPINDNKTEAGRKNNRRTSFVITKI
ncbi:WD40 repeat protein [Pedobacter psychrotolerans]|uniref:Cell envelope biogenesis protein OmpA n=1 Tax=Pedobacter psychrotolerans TaxID=1843235 RepID=A0A4R2HBR9_9SPHI|nr:OmpA family protein [Pedobacter psychrotolerans]TCO25088.1 WD40 repeat protein [Pedobacter psychrotolerans]GGE48197.1 cell envelope biogenesis protein OmpA [Pedobacter psychrotolerans]